MRYALSDRTEIDDDATMYLVELPFLLQWGELMRHLAAGNEEDLPPGQFELVVQETDFGEQHDLLLGQLGDNWPNLEPMALHDIFRLLNEDSALEEMVAEIAAEEGFRVPRTPEALLPLVHPVRIYLDEEEQEIAIECETIWEEPLELVVQRDRIEARPLDD